MKAKLHVVLILSVAFAAYAHASVLPLLNASAIPSEVWATGQALDSDALADNLRSMGSSTSAIAAKNSALPTTATSDIPDSAAGASSSIEVPAAAAAAAAPNTGGSAAAAADATANVTNVKSSDTATATDNDGTVGANYGPAQGCTPPTLPEPIPLGVPVATIPAGKRPNFIIILTDDQGWDDIGLHHPRKPGALPEFIKTPNLDKFLERSLKFDNFYVNPMCSHTRASLLTGRDYPRTGTMLVNGGYDYINRGERTAGHIMAADDYKSVHYGKWHNGRTLGYEPWHVGFEDSWFPELYINLDNLMRHNGHYVQTEGLMEQDLMDRMLGFLDAQAANQSQPFFLYYAPNAIHQGFLRPGQGPQWQRPAPEPYLAKYRHLLAEGVAQSTIEVWAMLEYMDDVLGRLFDYLEHSPLKEDTYIFLMSDNGSELFDGEIKTPGNLQLRMPSGMQGYKRAVEEGGIRNFLAVQGPGVQAGVIDSTLLDVTDVVPTMADLAGVPANAAGHLPFSGKSFKNLLLTGVEAPTSPRRGNTFASQEQQDRMLFSLSPICWDPDTVPALDADRKVIKPQPLLDYDTGSIMNRLYDYFYEQTGLWPGNATAGFERCVAVRYKDYKWIGRTGKVYRLPGDSHIELPCNEVTGEEAQQIAAKLSAAARQWWSDLVAEPHSFQKPTFYLGFEGWTVTNFLPDGAYDRTPGKIRLLPNGATGFQENGDRMCFSTEVATSGQYEVVVLYTSRAMATFQMAVGSLADIEAGSAPSITTQLPPTSVMAGQIMGTLQLPSSQGKAVDTCLTLINNTAPGTPVFLNLGNIRFTLNAQLPQAPPETETEAPEAPIGQDTTTGDDTADDREGTDSRDNADSADAAAAAGNDSTAGEGDDDDDEADDDDQTAVTTANLAASSQVSQITGSQTDDEELTAEVDIFGNWMDAVLPGVAPRWRANKPAVQANSVQTASDSNGKIGGRVPIAVPAPGVAAHNLPLTPGRSRRGSNLGPGRFHGRRRRAEIRRRHLKPTPAMKKVEQDAIAAADAATGQQKERATATMSAAWENLRQRHHWPDGQTRLESMYSPYAAEAIAACKLCQPRLH